MITRDLEPGSRIRLNIRNLVRAKSLYQDGMLPRISYLQEDNSRGPWHINAAVTTGTKFYPTTQDQSFDSEFANRDRNYSTLRFIYTVSKLDESIFFAYDVPYTFSGDLTRYLKSLNLITGVDTFMRKEVLCRTVTGLECPFLTITENA